MILRYVDAPEAVDFTVRLAAVTPGYLRYASAWEQWHFHRHRMGVASIEHLEKLWRASAEGEEVRTKAFHFWSIAVEGDLDALDNRLRAIVAPQSVTVAQDGKTAL
jgi:hypothetical protein